MEPAVTVRKEFVVVMPVLPTLQIFVWTCAKASTAEMEATAQVASAIVKKDMSR